MDHKLSVIICTYNRASLLAGALEAIAGQTLAAGQFEILLINNNSKDGTASVCSEFQSRHPELNFRYVLETRQGLSYARNRGIEEAQNDILVFMDDDAYAEKQYLQQIRDFFIRTPDAAAAGGRIYPIFESKRPRWMSSYLLSLASAIDLGNDICLFRKKYPIGANMIFRRETLQKYGHFNVNLGRRGDNMEGAEEKDLFLRISSAGEKIYYLPDAVVHHFIPDKRLTFTFFKRQATGIGYSEKVRAKNISGTAYLKSLFKEGIKWAGSCILCLLYFLKLRFAAGWRLLVFRWYVTKGLLKKNL